MSIPSLKLALLLFALAGGFALNCGVMLSKRSGRPFSTGGLSVNQQEADKATSENCDRVWPGQLLKVLSQRIVFLLDRGSAAISGPLQSLPLMAISLKSAIGS